MENIEKIKDYDLKNFALFQDYGITKELRQRFWITIYKNESEWFYRITFNAKDIKLYENILNKFSISESNFIQKGFNLTKDLICNENNKDKLLNLINEMVNLDKIICSKNEEIYKKNKNIAESLIKYIYSLGFNPWKSSNEQYSFPTELKEIVTKKFLIENKHIEDFKMKLQNVIFEGYNNHLETLKLSQNQQISQKNYSNEENNKYDLLESDKYFKLGLALYEYQYGENGSFQKILNIVNSNKYDEDIEKIFDDINEEEIDHKILKNLIHYTDVLIYSKNQDLINKYFEEKKYKYH